MKSRLRLAGVADWPDSGNRTKQQVAGRSARLLALNGAVIRKPESSGVGFRARAGPRSVADYWFVQDADPVPCSVDHSYDVDTLVTRNVEDEEFLKFSDSPLP